MAQDIVMPRLSDSMEEGTILRWLKSPGDEVSLGEELVEIETDKANMVYEAPAGGTLVETLAAEGDTLPIGQVIARVGEAGEKPSGNGAAAKRGAGGPWRSGAGRGRCGAGTVGGPRAGDGRARRPGPQRGREGEGISRWHDGWRARRGSTWRRSPARGRAGGSSRPTSSGRWPPGPRRRRLRPRRRRRPPPREPTPGARERPETAKGAVTHQDLTKLQQTVARRMAESKATAPHFQLSAEIDMSRAVAARARIKAAAKEGEVVPSFNDMVVKACAIALREHPRANGAYRDGRLELYSRINVGVAVAAQDALVVPTIFDADLKGLRQIASEARALAQRVRDGTVTPPELSGGTFTVSNLGMYGISNFQAVINPPQAGILAVGAITETPVVRDGEITTAHLMGVTLACDHRVLYGADGALFLARVRALLEEPLGLAL